MPEPSTEPDDSTVRVLATALWSSGVLSVGLALALSIALTIEFYGHSSMCALAACKTVSQSFFARSLPIPFPLVGLTGFSVQLVVAAVLFRNPSEVCFRVWQATCWIGGTVAIGLITVQLFWLRQICPLCMGVDAAAVSAAALSLHQSIPSRSEGRLLLRWLGVIGGIAVMSPIGWAWSQPVPTQPHLNDVLSGQMVVIVNTSFLCPGCQQIHPKLAPVLAKLGAMESDVRLEYRPLPFGGLRDSLMQTKYYYAANEFGFGMEIADFLYRNPTSDESAVRREVEQSIEPADAVIKAAYSERIAKRIEDHQREFDESQVPGIPSIWIDGRLYLSVASIDEAIDELNQIAERVRPPK